ncbi:MAG TPA: HD domain-containing phosphohydrolase [Anaerolineales bacterium]|nr:HD domain-containing phosphohydrolase [Anaerolineales bacterium]
MISDFKGLSTDRVPKQSDQIFRISSDIFAFGEQWARICVEQGNVTQAWIARVDTDNFVQWIAHWPLGPSIHSFPRQYVDKAIRFGTPITFQDHQELISGGIFPLLHEERVIGLIGLLSRQTDYFKPGTMVWINALASVISDSFLRQENDKKEQDAVEHSISRILQASIDIQDPLPAVLALLAGVVKADAATALRYNPSLRRFDLLATHGLSAPMLAKLKLYFETGLAGKFVEERQPIWVEDILTSKLRSRSIGQLTEEGFRSYLALPLIGHNDFLGILEFFWSMIPDIQIQDMEFLQRVTEQISLTMERSAIVRDLRRSNEGLISTYNAMIEGLSRALELRDIETEGHTRRVSVLMMRFGEHMQIPSTQWDAIKQGALLHDIGKLGIPDAILLKPGSLTQREREVMQQHAMYGYNILAPIINLRQTLDIALYHHERWNGSGYPYGLAGEQIPLVARLFAVVDVFDALTSDRPYRPAWSHQQAVEYLREQAGRLFDPQVVQLFLEIVDQQK